MAWKLIFYAGKVWAFDEETERVVRKEAEIRFVWKKEVKQIRLFEE